MTTPQTATQTLDTLLANREALTARRAQLEDDRAALANAIDAAQVARGARIADGEDGAAGADEIRTLTDRAEGTAQAVAVLDGQLASVDRAIASENSRRAGEAEAAALETLGTARAALRSLVAESVAAIRAADQAVRAAGAAADRAAGMAARESGRAVLPFGAPSQLQSAEDLRTLEVVRAMERYTMTTASDEAMQRAVNPRTAGIARAS